jgi:hypothetical protein
VDPVAAAGGLRSFVSLATAAAAAGIDQDSGPGGGGGGNNADTAQPSDGGFVVVANAQHTALGRHDQLPSLRRWHAPTFDPSSGCVAALTCPVFVCALWLITGVMSLATTCK